MREMDDRARGQQLRVCIRFAKEWPRSEPVEPVIGEDEALLQADYRSMDDVRKREILELAAWYVRHHPATDRADSLVVERPRLRLVVDNRAMGTTGGKREMTW
jgi:hypothetical protein